MSKPLAGQYSVTDMSVGRLDGKTVAVTGGHDGTVRVWDLAAGRQLGEPPHRPYRRRLCGRGRRK
ncbi:hypothetical protein [Acrocarpospora corrugata]|uniref:hypothetical protein n=1 Tax=Acrocarpospora corrugata TaxID=35763 RepID=UPI0012D2ED2B|nr:hypothetical protein [Acrocarpospora corrugata]